jgi:hypothetical protein
MMRTFMLFIVAWLWLWSCGSSDASTQLDHAAQERKAVFQLTGDEACDFPETGLSIATGHAQASISGQDANIEADLIVYDHYNGFVEAVGNVRIWRHKALTPGGKFVFRIGSDEYLVTQPGTKLGGSTINSNRVLSTLDRERLEYLALKISRSNYKPHSIEVENFWTGEHVKIDRDLSLPEDEPSATPKSNAGFDHGKVMLDEFLHGNRQSYSGYDAIQF